ncbi:MULTISPECIES: HAMP domain-containing sensor histidine kinase [unclassified Mucilaginibacter]|uniref:HAMP domain-containing sensor histidine kinase n=3 Tax=Mucilaginibacter TaxID=423349 RepID=UPI002AC8C8F0|nr:MULTISPECIES: HAMP domain-containing sensor histidine kinase [unclassified Mucilaginibacter]MEB0262931.1 HAMP domain-containing sensor histidine kinase [Mucilaginibacter sp. 10I4]MEB0278220.1 HAMP domain-containing sensor histidine kinase [Mucilaginibacter sp. 10B2]WPX23866.1 HAMP domain-containing sensor histidine kinase [Mucilaginibacter sp. 5C4]
MTIRNRLTFLFTGIIAALLLAFALVVYFSFSENREEEYYSSLRHTAITKANLVLDAKIAPSVLQLIYKQSPNTFFQEEVAIYDRSFHLLYHDAVEIDKVKETRQMIDEIVAKKQIKFYQGDMQAVGILYHHNHKDYVITSAANDQYGYAKRRNLKYTLLIAFFVAIIFIYIAGHIFSSKALKPVSDMVDEMEEITATNLDLRINEGNGKDEIAELAVTFNAMLNRLEKSFDAQKEFVSNISHELRTPLTAMLTELQVAAEKERSNEYYRGAIHHAISDAQKIVRLSNSLLDLAKANYDHTEITFKELRLDELILDARNDAMHDQPGSKINIVFEKEIEDDDFISVMGNEYLLKVAFINLMENGCKFSKDNEAAVAITYFKDKTILRFQDHGIGMDEAELKHIFTAFYRGANQQFAGGNGIGLSLTKKIIDLHKGTIAVSSQKNEGTTFTVELPHI